MNAPIGLEWTPGEAATVNEFLNTPVGRKWLGVLLLRKPRLDLTSTEKAALTGAFAAGYETFFSQIAATRMLAPVQNPDAQPIDMTRD